MARILATLAAAFIVALALSHSPVQAEPQIDSAVGQPLKLTPTFRHAFRHAKPIEHKPIEHKQAERQVEHTGGGRVLRAVVPQRMARRHAAPAAAAALRDRGEPRDQQVMLQEAPTLQSFGQPVAALQSPSPQTAAAGGGSDHPVLVRGPDSKLIGMLPWWRNDPLTTIQYLDRETNSGVLAAADAWLAPPVAEGQVAANGFAAPRSSSDEASEFELDPEITVADAGDINAIDLLAVAVAGPRLPDQPWLHAWLAMVAGALAAAAAARYLFT